MAEYIDHGFVASCETLIDAACIKVDERYGPNGKKPLPYHNRDHTNDVVRDVERLATEAGLEPRAKHLLRVAGAYHDLIHGEGPVVSEQKSADAAVKAMEQNGSFEEPDLLIVRNAIMATVMRPDRAGRLVQSAADGDILSQLLADADLAYLGGPTDGFWPIAQRYFKENYPASSRNAETYSEFNTMQLEFLSGHAFYTPEANQLFPHQPENIESIREAIANKPDPATHYQ